MKDVDIREGLDAIADAVRTCSGMDEDYEIWNSDEDYDEDPAPRCVMMSMHRHELLTRKMTEALTLLDDLVDPLLDVGVCKARVTAWKTTVRKMLDEGA